MVKDDLEGLKEATQEAVEYNYFAGGIPVHRDDLRCELREHKWGVTKDGIIGEECNRCGKRRLRIDCKDSL